MSARSRLKRYRAWRKISQSKLAREVGCDPSTINKVEAGERRLCGEFAFRLEDLTQAWDSGPIKAREWLEN